MFQYHIVEMQVKSRQADAKRARHRDDMIRQAQENGMYEVSGLWVTLVRRVSGLSRGVSRRKWRVDPSPVRATPCQEPC